MGYTSTTVPAEVVAALPAYLQAQIPLYDETFQPNLHAAATVCLFLAYLAVGLRFYARRLKAQKLGWDDYTIAVSLFLNSAFIAVFLYLTILGLGRHEVVLVLEHPDRAVAFGKALLAAEVLYNPATACTKFAILMLYHRLFAGRVFKRVCIGVAVFVTAYSLTAIFTNMFQCTSTDSHWSASLSPHCVNLGGEQTLLIFISSINVVTDAVVLALPMPFIWRLRTDRYRKMQLTIVMLLGSFVVVVSIIRASIVTSFTLTDGPWDDAKSAMWSVVETAMGVVAACLPVLRPVFNKLVYGDAEGSRTQTDASTVSWKKPDIVTFGGSGPTRDGSFLQMNRLGTKTIGNARGSLTRLVDEW